MNKILKKALKRLDQVPENLEEIVKHKIMPFEDLKFQIDKIREVTEEVHEGLKREGIDVNDPPEPNPVHGGGTGTD